MKAAFRFCRRNVGRIYWAFAFAVVALLVLSQLVMLQVPSMERAQNKCQARNPGRMHESGWRFGRADDTEGGPSIFYKGQRTYTLVAVRQELLYFRVRCVFEADDPEFQPRLVTVGLWTYL